MSNEEETNTEDDENRRPIFDPNHDSQINNRNLNSPLSDEEETNTEDDENGRPISSSKFSSQINSGNLDLNSPLSDEEHKVQEVTDNKTKEEIIDEILKENNKKVSDLHNIIKSNKCCDEALVIAWLEKNKSLMNSKKNEKNLQKKMLASADKTRLLGFLEEKEWYTAIDYMYGLIEDEGIKKCIETSSQKKKYWTYSEHIAMHLIAKRGNPIESVTKDINGLIAGRLDEALGIYIKINYEKYDSVTLFERLLEHDLPISAQCLVEKTYAHVLKDLIGETTNEKDRVKERLMILLARPSWEKVWKLWIAKDPCNRILRQFPRAKKINQHKQKSKLFDKSRLVHTINYLWINKEDSFVKNPYICREAHEDINVFYGAAFQWIQKDPFADINIWYDSQYATRYAYWNTKLFLKRVGLDNQIHIRDIQDIPTIKENKDITSSDIPVYYRADLIRNMILLHELERNIDYAIYIDLDTKAYPRDEEHKNAGDNYLSQKTKNTMNAYFEKWLDKYSNSEKKEINQSAERTIPPLPDQEKREETSDDDEKDLSETQAIFTATSYAKLYAWGILYRTHSVYNNGTENSAIFLAKADQKAQQATAFLVDYGIYYARSLQPNNTIDPQGIYKLISPSFQYLYHLHEKLKIIVKIDNKEEDYSYKKHEFKILEPIRENHHPNDILMIYNRIFLSHHENIGVSIKSLENNFDFGNDMDKVYIPSIALKVSNKVKVLGYDDKHVL